MARSYLISQLAFPVTLTITVAVSLLPGSALHWTAPLGEIMTMILTPFAWIGETVGTAIRPPPGSFAGTDINEEYVRHLQEEMVTFEQHYYAEQTKVASLEQQLQQLQALPGEAAARPGEKIAARIALRSPSSPLGLVTLNRGSRHRVKPGDVALYNHVYIIGRVTEDVSAVQCVLRPLANVATGRITASVLAHDRPSAAVSLPDVPRLLLEPRGDGTLITEPDQSVVVSVGDEVILTDDSWPAAVQGMKIGTVEDVRPHDQKPLRNIVVVRPTYQASQVSVVALRVDAAEHAPGSGGGSE